MTDSILESTKKVLGVPAEYKVFDSDIIMHINSVFFTLNQLGLGPIDGFEIEDDTAIWDNFLLGSKRFNSVKSYMYLKVRLLFDPPTTSYLITAFKEQAAEYEWRLSAQRETRSTLLIGGHKKITGNLGDEHRIRLANPAGQTLINATGSYEAEFAARDGRTSYGVSLDTSERASGILYMPVTITDGTYTVRSLSPRRTILVLDVSVQ